MKLTSKTSSSERSINDWADLWRYGIGVNVIPADTRNKRPKVDWKQYQNARILEQQHEKWKQQNDFDGGMAIIPGKLWHNTAKKDLFLICVDLDNEKAINEFCTRDGVKTPLLELSQHVIIEQHKDEPNKAHVIFYGTHAFPKKSSDMAVLSEKLRLDETPSVEVKGAGEHGILFVSPSPHKNGFNYQVIGTTEPEVADQFELHIQTICKKFGIQYPKGDATCLNAPGNTPDLIPIQNLFKDNTRILEGHNRHEALLRIMESLLKRNQNILGKNKIKELAHVWNLDHCIPPLNQEEEEKQWNDAEQFVERENNQRQKERQREQEIQQKELYEQKMHEDDERKKEQKAPLSIHSLARLNEQGATHYGTGLLSTLGGLYKMIRGQIVKCRECNSTKTIIFPHPVAYSDYTSARYFAAGSCRVYFNSFFCEGRVKSTPIYVNAVNVELTDINSLQDLDKLRLILFEDDTKEVDIGESVTVLGTTFMQTSKPDGKGITYPVVYAQSVKYENREQEELTVLDIQAITRFRNRFPDNKNLIDKLVSMMACNVIGHNNIKEGILYMLANAKPDKRERRERIHGAIVSMPGRAKTALLMSATKLMTRSTFETAQMATGLSLLAIVEKDGDNKILRLGPVAKSLFCGLDEMNKLSSTDQEKFYGVMQEGSFTSNKFAKNQRIVAPVTILASMNPPEGTAVDTDGRIDLSDMNIIQPIWDRFDLKFYIPPMKNESEIRELAYTKADLQNKETPDYSKLLRKWFVYGKLKYNPKLAQEAISICVEAYIDMTRNNNTISPRRLETLFNLTRARARLLLKDVADANDAKAIVEFYNEMIKNYVSKTIAPRDPIDIGVGECYKILDESTLGDLSIPYTVEELLAKACERNPQVDKYLKSGVNKKNVFDRRESKRARNIYDRLIARHSKINIVNKNPTKLSLPRSVKPASYDKEPQHESVTARDHCDSCDQNIKENETENSNSDGPEIEYADHEMDTKSLKNISNDKSAESQRSQGSHSNINTANMDFPQKCYYCSYSQYQTKQEYQHSLCDKPSGQTSLSRFDRYQTARIIFTENEVGNLNLMKKWQHGRAFTLALLLRITNLPPKKREVM